MAGMHIEDFYSLPFDKKLSYLYEHLKRVSSAEKLGQDYIDNPIEKGCNFLLGRMEEHMDERAAEYMFDFELLDRNRFRERFGYDGGVCTKDLNIYISESVLSDAEVVGGTTLFHERLTKSMKNNFGQFVPILEECLAHRALFISMGAYEEMRPVLVYPTLQRVFGDYLGKLFSNYEQGDKFKDVFRLLFEQDENNAERKVVPSYLVD